MEFIPLISIPLIYFTVAIIKPSLKLKFNLCAICTAISATWFLLAALWLLNLPVSSITLGILIGMSISGFMYKSEAFYKKNKIHNFWFVRLVIIIGGFYGTIFFLQKDWGTITTIAIFGSLAIVVASLLFQKITHEDVIAEHGDNKKSGILKKLENCC